MAESGLGPVARNAEWLMHDLLAWYDRDRRHLPWRAAPGERPDPYRVWLSEVMLQQTTVAGAAPYYARFLAAFPTLAALAAAGEEAVLRAWAGLGYYARARNLHACARAVVAMGGFPRDVASLRQLPGIGPYTATAIAFGVPGIAVDGNVARVLSRLAAIKAPLPAALRDVTRVAEVLGRAPAAVARPADAVQALFDLGAGLCGKTKPACALCPWRKGCAAEALGLAAELPARAPKPSRPTRYGAVFRVRDAAGHVLLRRRPPEGLLGGMDELPGTPWRATPWSEAEALAFAPDLATLATPWAKAAEVHHLFTHFRLHLIVYAATAETGTRLTAPDTAALPSVMRKCLR